MNTVIDRLAIDTELVRPVLVNFLREKIGKVGWSGTGQPLKLVDAMGE